ncbi:uncharacterized protein LOC135811474 [Sycon ciliatum]|uniref:uncharacterized protein LOC135811474 n=1 Tax=Sycon ciliatum TaxID=27933 RepID=UPI0031F65B0C
MPSFGVNSQTSVAIVTAAAAVLGLYAIWYWSKDRPRRRRSHERPRKTSQEIRQARLEYLERHGQVIPQSSAASDAAAENSTQQTIEDNEGESIADAAVSNGLANTSSKSTSVPEERTVSGRKASLASLPVERARSMPIQTPSSSDSSAGGGGGSSRGSRTPTSPARAMFFKRQNSVVATQSNPNHFHSRYLYAPHPPIADPSFDDETGSPVINPVRTAEGILKWCPGFDEFSVAWCALQRRSVVRCNAEAEGELQVQEQPRARLVACHDMMGGYLEDRLCQGASSTHGAPQFHLKHWNMIDTFIYFSHHLVTIPPPTWTNAAHVHGVPILGTFITEWDDGAEACKRLLGSVEYAHTLAEKLAAMAEYYRFDGWLINIENPIAEESVPVVCEFLQHLTRKVNELVGGHGCVLWYDSVTKDGKLSWQNKLNDLNSMFYHSCDGIFLNYNWTEDGLEESRALAGAAEALDRVFVGIDVFGRGCPGGGGYNSIQALETISSHGLSAALFAFGWVWETQDKSDFSANMEKFWRLLSPRCVQFCPASLPILTSFSLGMGDALYIHGKKVRDGAWLHLSAQDLLPNALEAHSSAMIELEKFEYETGCVYNGGHVLAIKGRTCMQEPASGNISSKDCAHARFMTAHCGVNHPLIVSVTHRVQGPVDVALCLFVNLPSGHGVQLVLPLTTCTDTATTSSTAATTTIGAASVFSGSQQAGPDQPQGIDSLDEKLHSRYGVCRSHALNSDATDWLVERLIQQSEPTGPLSRNASITLPVSSTSSLASSPRQSDVDGVSPSPSASPCLSSADLSRFGSGPLVEGFTELRGADQAKLDSLAMGVPADEVRRHKSPRWKTSHFLVAGQHIRSFHIKDIALVCKPSSADDVKSSRNFNTSVDKDDETFDIKLGELRLAEARWARSEFHEAPFALRCGGVQWQLCPSVVLKAPATPSGMLISVLGCTPSYLDMTLLWDHGTPQHIAHFDIYVYGLEIHRLCIEPEQQKQQQQQNKPKSGGTESKPAVSLPDVHEDAPLSTSSSASVSASVDGSSASAAALGTLGSFMPAPPSVHRRPVSKPEYLGRAYGLSYHISRMPLVCRSSGPSPELFKKTTSLSSVTTSSQAAGSTPSPLLSRRPSHSTPTTPAIEQPAGSGSSPPQHIWLAVQAVSRAGFRLPLDRSPCVCFSWS